MNNEDIVSLMERYKRELLEFEKRNTAPVSAQEKAEPEPVSAQQESQAEQVSAQVQEDAEPVNAPAAEPAKAVSAKAEENEAVSAAATVTIQRQTDAQRESQMQFDDGADTDKSQFTPERTQAAGRRDIPQPRTIFVDPQTLKNKNLTSTNTQSAMQRFDEFKSECNKRGILRVETYGSNGLYPVGNSRVVVYKEIDGEKYYMIRTPIRAAYSTISSCPLPTNPYRRQSRARAGSRRMRHTIYSSATRDSSAHISKTFRSSTPPFQYNRSKCCRRSAASRIRM